MKIQTFQKGDRVHIESLDDTGTVEDSNDKISTVFVDNPERLRVKFRPTEKTTVVIESSEPKTMKYHTHTADLSHISSSNPDPEWKSMWDESAE